MLHMCTHMDLCKFDILKDSSNFYVTRPPFSTILPNFEVQGLDFFRYPKIIQGIILFSCNF